MAASFGRKRCSMHIVPCTTLVCRHVMPSCVTRHISSRFALLRKELISNQAGDKLPVQAPMTPAPGRWADVRDNQVIVVRGAELESDRMADAGRQMHWRHISHDERWMARVRCRRQVMLPRRASRRAACREKCVTSSLWCNFSVRRRPALPAAAAGGVPEFRAVDAKYHRQTPRVTAMYELEIRLFETSV